MLNKKINVPMLAGIILGGIAFIIDLWLLITQKSVVSKYAGVTYDGILIPAVFVSQIITLFIFFMCYFIMRTYRGKRNRAVGIGMIVLYCLVGILTPFLTVGFNFVATKMGVNYVGAMSILNSIISAVTSPLYVISGALILISIGRYGIMDPSEILSFEEVPEAKDDAALTDGTQEETSLIISGETADVTEDIPKDIPEWETETIQETVKEQETNDSFEKTVEDSAFDPTFETVTEGTSMNEAPEGDKQGESDDPVIKL